MMARKNVQRFFDTYDPENSAHVRVLRMLVEGVYDGGGLSELEELAGVHADSLRAVAKTASREEGATEDEARFDPERQPLFAPAARDAGEGAVAGSGTEDVSRAKRPRKDDDAAIPGIGDFSNKNHHPETPGRTTSNGAGASSPRNNDPQPNSAINKGKLDPESIFYQNIFVPSKPTHDSSLSIMPRDPAYLFPPLQCKLCGLRFVSSLTDAFGTHIEDHRRKTRALGDKMVLRREFFSSRVQKVPVRLNLSLNGGTEAVIWNKECPQCIVCGSTIKKTWRDDVEDWVLDGGTRVNDREFAHRDCVL